MEFIFAIVNLKVNKLRRNFLAIQPCQEKITEYIFVIGFCKVERNVKCLFGVVINFDVLMVKF